VFKDILFTVDLEHADSWRKALPAALDERSGRAPACT
jgi:hypothetical protein